jgi:hypothetical protein
MYTVEAARSRLIIISAAGRVTAQELQTAAARVREIVSDFAPGFQALTDFRWLESMDAAAAPHIADIMDALAAKQVATVLRVMPDPRKDIGLNILSQFHYGPSIRILTFETLADAIESLGAYEE